MHKAKDIGGITTEQCGSQAYKAENIQALNTIIFYNLICLKHIPHTSAFSDLVSNYNIFLHRKTYFSLQRVDTTKETRICTLSKL